MSTSIFRSSWVFLLAGLAGCGANNGSSGGGSPTAVTYNFTGPAPAVVATQIGSGMYTLATLTSGKLTFSVPSGETNYSVAYLCPAVLINPSVRQEYINQASILDGTSFSGTCTPKPSLAGLAAAQVNATAIPGAEGISIANQEFPGNTLNLSLDLADGTYDVAVVVTGVAGQYVAIAAKILRNQAIPGALNGGTPVIFEPADETVPQTITYEGLPDGYSVVGRSVAYHTAGGASVQLDNNEAPLTQYLSMPLDAYESGDYYNLIVEAEEASRSGGLWVEKYASNPGPQSFTFPSPWSYDGPTPAALPTFSFAYTGFSGMPNISQQANIDWSQGELNQGTLTFNGITVTATANYQNGTTALHIPDLSNLSGFLSPAPSGTIVNWYAKVYQGSNPLLTSPPSGTVQWVDNSGSYTEP